MFVHGIYGGDTTFKNPKTDFDWPKNIGASIQGRPVDVFSLRYENALFAWAQGMNPSFDLIARQIKEVLKPLRSKQYRSIGFITHSLGGNIISTYMLMVLTNPGHPQRSQVAYVINLATPTYGAQIASIAVELKKTLRMNDYLLESLEQNNLYLVMLYLFRSEENQKAARNGCRPSNLYLAFEEKPIAAGQLVVSKNSATGQRDEVSKNKSVDEVANNKPVDEVASNKPVENKAATGVKGFYRDHLDISKPVGTSDDVYTWVSDILNNEFRRLSAWDDQVKYRTPETRLCEDIPFHEEL